MNKDNIVIFSVKVARDLIQNGFMVVDISENNQRKNKTVFYFSNNEKIKQYLKEKWNIEIN